MTWGSFRAAAAAQSGGCLRAVADERGGGCCLRAVADERGGGCCSERWLLMREAAAAALERWLLMREAAAVKRALH
jgi:hypothetical protein